MRKIICGAAIAISFLWILGSAGSLELERITLAGFVAQTMPAVVALYVSFWIGGFTK